MAQQFDLEQMKEMKEYLMSNDRVGVDIPVPAELFTQDELRFVLNKGLINKKLSPVLRIFPWIHIPISNRIKESSFDPQELWEALVYFKRPLDDAQSDLFLSLLDAPSVVELLESKPLKPMRSLGAVVALHKAYRDILQVKEQFGDDAELWDRHVDPEVAEVFRGSEEEQDMSESGDGAVQDEGLGDDLPPLGMMEELARELQPGSGGEDMSGADECPSGHYGDLGDGSSDDDDEGSEFSISRLYWRSPDASPSSPPVLSASDTSTVCESPAEKDGPALESRVDDLEGRVSVLEGDTTEMRDGKRIRSGRDRAAWMRIKRAHIHNRDKWCKPGAVMGVFPRGIGPLDSSAAIRKILQVVVYSTDPDTIEEFPAGADRSEWAPIVMIGEAPVALTDYSKYTSKSMHKKNSTVYVHLPTGHVDVCEGLNVPDPNCFRIGTATAGHSIIGEGGFPYFQNTLGVCAAIESTKLTAAPLLPFAIQRDVSRHSGLIAKKITKRAKNHDGAVLRNIAKAFSGLSVASSSSEKKKHNHDIGLMVSNRTADMGFELALTPNGERIEVISVREGSAAAELGVTIGDKVKDVGGWTKQKALKKGITGLMKYIETAPRPLRIVIRHKGFVATEDSTSETSNSKSKSKGDGKNKKSK